MKKVKETIGKICIDLGKLTFGSFILGSILKGDIERMYILAAGAVVALMFFLVGIFLTK
jgi:hypothetical protein